MPAMVMNRLNFSNIKRLIVAFNEIDGLQHTAECKFYRSMYNDCDCGLYISKDSILNRLKYEIDKGLNNT